MSTGNYIIVNNELFPSGKVMISVTNRAFNYGDSLFETIRCAGSHPLFLSSHLDRAEAAMRLLKMEMNPDLAERNIGKLISRLLNANKHLTGARVRLTIFRAGEGLYTPETCRTAFVMTSSPLEHQEYMLNASGLNIGVIEEPAKVPGPFSSFKSGNSLPYVLAGIQMKENEWDDCLLKNTSGKIIEGLSSNLYLVHHGKISTPDTSSGCVDGIIRKFMMTHWKEKLIENDGFSPEDLLCADEAFLTNTISGVRWIRGFEKRRYFAKVSKQIIAFLNEALSRELRE